MFDKKNTKIYGIKNTTSHWNFNWTNDFDLGLFENGTSYKK